MKKVMTLIGCLMFSLLLFGQNETEQNFKKANEAYTAKQYSTAIQLYETILDSGVHSAEVYYNLGSSYYKNQEIGKAILNYERGLQLTPGDDDLRYNLNLLQAELKDDLSEIPPFFLGRWWKETVQLASSTIWGGLGLLLLWLGVGGLMMWLLGKERSQRKRGFVMGIVLLLLSALPFSLAVGKANLDENSGVAILLEKETSLRTAPDGESSELLLLHEGAKLELLDAIGEWYKVRLINGEEGWLPMTVIEKI